MGGSKILTYTLQKETGASLRGAGWQIAAKTRPGGWARTGRKRQEREIYNEPKIRWEAVIS